MSSSCVQYTGPDIPCLDICKPTTVTDVEYQMGKLVCALANRLDLSSLDITPICGTGALQCCPEGWQLIQLTDGTYACRNIETGLVSVRELIPCPSTPCPEKTLVNVLQLIINKLHNCCP